MFNRETVQTIKLNISLQGSNLSPSVSEVEAVAMSYYEEVVCLFILQWYIQFLDHINSGIFSRASFEGTPILPKQQLVGC